MRHPILQRIFLLFVAIYIILPIFALADTSSADPAYPGEVKEFESGKKVKLWSTKGPVPVSRASEPFQLPSEKTIPTNTFINVTGAQQGPIRTQIQNQRKENQRGHKKDTESSLPLE